MNNNQHKIPRVFSQLIPVITVIVSGLLAAPTYGQFIFDPTVSVPAGPQPGGAAVGDLDGDGDIDLATGIRFPDRVVILLNDGNGAFALGATINYPMHSEPESVIAGDLDGDGDIDLAVILGALSEIRIAINNGGLNFTHGSITPIGFGGRGGDIKDMDGDGDLDIAVANRGSNTVTVLENNGNATFSTTTLASPGEPRAVSFGDLDGDDDLDLAVTNNDGFNVRLFRNDAGVFNPWHILSTAPNQAEGVTIADLDNDGEMDIATGAEDDNTGVNNAVVFFNNGAGTTFEGPIAFNTSAVGTSGVVAVDLDCDGLLDLALSNQDSNNVSLIKNMGARAFGTASLLTIGTNPEALSHADLNGDGLADLVTGNRDSANMSVMINQTCSPAGPIGDLDGDGSVNTTDLLILFANWGSCPGKGDCPADLDGNGVVNTADLLILFANWG